MEHVTFQLPCACCEAELPTSSPSDANDRPTFLPAKKLIVSAEYSYFLHARYWRILHLHPSARLEGEFRNPEVGGKDHCEKGRDRGDERPDDLEGYRSQRPGPPVIGMEEPGRGHASHKLGNDDVHHGLRRDARPGDSCASLPSEVSNHVAASPRRIQWPASGMSETCLLTNYARKGDVTCGHCVYCVSSITDDRRGTRRLCL
jgi:hypothetical protein